MLEFDVDSQIEILNSLIPMKDGVKLSAKIWIYKDRGDAKIPGILEYIPYRKRDYTALRDEIMHPYFASKGYASCRVDMRGCGESEGLMTDEYTPTEHADAETVIEWIASQPWCNGNVGMQGKSWGGFNSLQVAWNQPRFLKAVITVCSTDDRFADDIHHLGGYTICVMSVYF